MKRCSKCNVEKDLSAFHKDKHKKSGMRSECKDCALAYKKVYDGNNKPQKKEYYQKNKEKILDKRKEHYKNNKEEIIQYQCAYHKERRKNDPVYRMINNYRRRTRSAYIEGTKSKSTIELLGCTGPELKEHLEKQFQPGMTHDNYGDWEMDHIRPVASFDLSDPKQEQECWHYTNLQPLWAEDNRKKSDKWT